MVAGGAVAAVVAGGTVSAGADVVSAAVAVAVASVVSAAVVLSGDVSGAVAKASSVSGEAAVVCIASDTAEVVVSAGSFSGEAPPESRTAAIIPSAASAAAPTAVRVIISGFFIYFKLLIFLIRICRYGNSITIFHLLSRPAFSRAGGLYLCFFSAILSLIKAIKAAPKTNSETTGEKMNFREEAKELVAKMTLEEKCAQLKYDAPAIERLGIPAYNWWNEGLHGAARAGTATVFPQAVSLAATFDTELLEKAADVISTEARAKYNVSVENGDRDIYKGLTLWSPNINIFRDPRWGRGQETYGEDPYLTAELGKAFVRGLQGDGELLKTAACAKHFAVHSGPEKLRHEFDAVVSEKDLYETYLYAFEELVKNAKVESVMGAYNMVDGEPCCGSGRLSAVLREWGFDGYFVSDCWAIADFHVHHKITATAPESAALALKNGCDLNCGSTYLHILSALQEGLIDESDITRAAETLMTTRLRLGMGRKTEFDSLGIKDIATDENKALSESCAEKSAVLLKNNGILPLDRGKISSIAVIGPNADSRAALIGNYHGTASEYVTLVDGIRRSCDCRVYYSEGCHLFGDKIEGLALPDDRISEAVACAKEADVTVLCLGLNETIEGEEGDAGNEYGSGDKGDLMLPASQRRLLEAVLKTEKPVIVAIAAGSAISCDDERIAATLWLGYSGEQGGNAFARLLFGDASPSGKLPVTFYKSAELLPDFTDYSMKNRTYRYLESGENVLFPFGFGLTYGEIRCEGLAAEAENGAVTVRVTAKNSGAVYQEDVIQLYLENSSVYSPKNPALCGFKRIGLAPGESAEVVFTLSEKAFTVVNQEGKRALDRSAGYTLYAGTSQPDDASRRLTGKSPVSADITAFAAKL